MRRLLAFFLLLWVLSWAFVAWMRRTLMRSLKGENPDGVVPPWTPFPLFLRYPPWPPFPRGKLHPRPFPPPDGEGKLAMRKGALEAVLLGRIGGGAAALQRPFIIGERGSKGEPPPVGEGKQPHRGFPP